MRPGLNLSAALPKKLIKLMTVVPEIMQQEIKPSLRGQSVLARPVFSETLFFEQNDAVNKILKGQKPQ